MTVLVPVLGDQLSHSLASLQGCGPANTVVLMMEVADEVTHVRHHKAKIALIFSAMRHFAADGVLALHQDPGAPPHFAVEELHPQFLAARGPTCELVA